MIPGESAMSSLLGVPVYRTIPAGEEVGATFEHEGEILYVTKSELDRLQNLPTADEIRRQVATMQALTNGAAYGND